MFSLVDVIYAQAGVDVDFTYRPGTYNSSFARTGTPGNNNPRPQSDLGSIRNAAAAAGNILSVDSNTINAFLVTIAPGFSQLSANSAAGLATINGNGVAYYGGSALSSFAGGRDVLASVLSHEIGHNLGLSHNTTNQNLMESGAAEDGQRLDAAQIATILASRFTVAAPTTLPGDFNADQRVDGADLLAWQRGGSPTPRSTTDLNTWRTNFGRSAVASGIAAGLPVPEPATAPMLLIAASLAFISTARSTCPTTGRRRPSNIPAAAWCASRPPATPRG